MLLFVYQQMNGLYLYRDFDIQVTVHRDKFL